MLLRPIKGCNLDTFAGGVTQFSACFGDLCLASHPPVERDLHVKSQLTFACLLCPFNGLNSLLSLSSLLPVPLNA